MTIIENQIRGDLPQVGVLAYHQVHAHSTGNPNSTAQNEASYMSTKDINTGFFTHVVGNGRIIQTGNVNRGAWDVGGGWNYETYAAVELIESHTSQAEFNRDYAIYVQLLRDLANQAGIPIAVDSGDTGILTHRYCTYNQPSNGSDHVDPYLYLAKWGISSAQFKHDVESGTSTTKVATQTKKTATKKGAKAMFVYTYYKSEADRKAKKGGELWGVNGNTRFHFSTKAQWDFYLKIVGANGGDTNASNVWVEGSVNMQTVKLLAPNVSQK